MTAPGRASKLCLMARPRASATFREAPHGEIYLHVHTRKPLGPYRVLDQHIDITGESEERELLERLLGQESFEIVWKNERIRATKPVHEVMREHLLETLARFPDLDRATWKEAVAEHEWRSSENWRPGPRPRKPKRRTAEPPAGAELRCSRGAAAHSRAKAPRPSRA